MVEGCLQQEKNNKTEETQQFQKKKKKNLRERDAELVEFQNRIPSW
jgi:hypothetical protein